MLAVLFLALFAGAAHAIEYVRPINGDCLSLPPGTTEESGLDLFPDQIVMTGDELNSTDPRFTEVFNTLGFSAKYYFTYKVVTNDVAGESYVLYQCGSTPPAADDPNVPKGAKFFQIPLTSVSMADTVPVAFMEALGLDDRVQSVPTYITSPCGQFVLECNRTAPDFTVLDNVTVLEETVSPVADALLVTTPSNYSKAFAFSATQDDGPVIKRLEWMKYLALFFNLGKEASDVYAAILANYDGIRDAALAGVAEIKTPPAVAFAQHFLYESDGFVEESYQISFAYYKGNGTVDAGGKFLDREALLQVPGTRVNSFSPTTVEYAWGQNGTFKSKAEAHAAFLEALKAVDVVVDETFAADPTDAYDLAKFREEYGLDDPAAQDAVAELSWLPALRIFRLDGRLSKTGGLDWFESAVARPGEALTDLVRVVASGYKAIEDDAFIWLRRINETSRVITSDACERLESCTAEIEPICPYVTICPDGTTALLQSSSGEGDTCTYAPCTGAPTPAGPAAPGNTAQMAAPAVILLTVLIVFVEALINFC